MVGYNFWKKEKKESLTSKCSGFFHLLVMFTLPNEEKGTKVKL